MGSCFGIKSKHFQTFDGSFRQYFSTHTYVIAWRQLASRAVQTLDAFCFDSFQIVWSVHDRVCLSIDSVHFWLIIFTFVFHEQSIESLLIPHEREVICNSSTLGLLLYNFCLLLQGQFAKTTEIAERNVASRHAESMSRKLHCNRFSYLALERKSHTLVSGAL